jgi:hypothetical protein
MTQPNVPKHQHWVPQFYLEYFATEDTRHAERPQAWRFDKESGAFDEKPTWVRNLCGKRYLYSPVDAKGMRDPETEAFLSRPEDETAPEWRKLARGEADLRDPTLRTTIARFVAAMQLRNYSLYSLFNSSIEIANNLYPLPQGSVRADGVNPRNASEVFVSQLHSGLPKMTDTFVSKVWYTVSAPTDAFVTSDKPVLFIHKSRMPGPGTPGAISALAINPRSALVMLDKGTAVPIRTSHVVDAAFVQLFNRETLHRCHKIIITGRSPIDVARELGIGPATSPHF